MSSEPALGALVVGVGSLPTAELLIVGIEASGSAPRTARTEVRYDLVGAVGAGRAERLGRWRIEWTREAGSDWRIVGWTRSSRWSRTRSRRRRIVELVAEVHVLD